MMQFCNIISNKVYTAYRSCGDENDEWP